jgi:hypothetical protein
MDMSIVFDNRRRRGCCCLVRCGGAVSAALALSSRGEREPQVLLEQRPVGQRRRHQKLAAAALQTALDVLNSHRVVRRADVNVRHFGALRAHSHDENVIHPEKVSSKRRHQLASH